MFKELVQLRVQACPITVLTAVRDSGDDHDEIGCIESLLGEQLLKQHSHHWLEVAIQCLFVLSVQVLSALEDLSPYLDHVLTY